MKYRSYKACGLWWITDPTGGPGWTAPTWDAVVDFFNGRATVR